MRHWGERALVFGPSVLPAPMTSQGGDLTRYRRAVASGNALVTLAAAYECPALEVDDAFGVLLALADGADADRERYERAVVRWLARAASELRPPLNPTELQLLLAGLRALPTAAATPAGAAGLAAADALATLFEVRALRQATRALNAWRDRRA